MVMLCNKWFKEPWSRYLKIFVVILVFSFSIIPAACSGLIEKAQAAEAALPVIYGVHPGNLNFTFDRTPSIAASLKKGGAEIDSSSLRIKLDGIDVTPSAQVNFAPGTQSGTVSFVPAADLAYGEHEVELSVSDKSGRNQRYSWYFVIDRQLSPNPQFYYGNPHSHTSFSDGLGIPIEAYNYAYSVGLDFLILTDHSNMLEGDRYDATTKEYIGQPGSEWTGTAETAQFFNAVHKDFLALRGFEMTFTELGHLNAFNTNRYVEANTMTSLAEFYDWLVKQPGAIGEFNHPKWPDTSFDSLAYSREADRAINVIEVANGRMPYSYTRMEEYYYKALDNGWHVGAVNVQDNHGTNWGETDNLTVVVADRLSEEEFYQAYKQRRVYATESRTLELTFKGNGYWMGSVLEVSPGDPLKFDIVVADRQNPIADVSLITNKGTIVATHQVNGAAGEWHPQVVPGAGDHWYVVRVNHKDGRCGISSPIFSTDGGVL